MRSFAALFLLAAVAVPTMTGCDEGLPSDPDDLLLDARIARQSGDLNEAVDLYERAHAANEDDTVVRVELASALMEQADLGVADLDRVATYILDEANGNGLGLPAPFAGAGKSGAQCPYEGAEGAEPFDLREVPDYARYAARKDVSGRVRQLLDPVMSDVLRPEDFLCTGIADGDLTYDREAAAAALRRADERLTDDQIAAALAMNAVTEAMDAYLTLSTDLAESADWYRLSNGTLGVCPVEMTEEELRAMAAGSIASLGEALVSTDLRAHLLGNAQVSTELVDVVLDAYEEVRDDLAPFCGA